MSSDKTLIERAAELLHLRGQGLSKGDPLALPLTSSSMFHLPGDPEGYPGYGRVNNPTVEAVEASLGLLEDAPTLCFPSGMGAISAALFATLSAGQTLLVPTDGYYVTRVLASDFLEPLGVTILQRPTETFADGGFDGIDVVFLETPSNPGLNICDIVTISRDVRAQGGVTIVDNTTMTPFGQRPLDLGADIVVASDTKAPGGHSDVLLGHVSTRRDDLFERLRHWRNVSGAIVAPQAAWMLHRSLETLEVRFARMCASAAVIAERLEVSGKLVDVRYPSMFGGNEAALVAAQMQACGFLIGLEFASKTGAEQFINTCTMLRPTTSFGGVHSSAERRARWGDAVSDGFVRLSVGCEPVEPLWDAIKIALQEVK